MPFFEQATRAPCRRQGDACRPPGTPSTKNNAGFRRCPRGGTVQRCCSSRANRPAQCGFFLGGILLARHAADVFNKPLRRRLGAIGFLAHLHSSMVTMSQKSSFPQPVKSVSQALTPDSGRSKGLTSLLVSSRFVAQKKSALIFIAPR